MQQGELEERLFGTTSNSLAEFGKEEEWNAKRLPQSGRQVNVSRLSEPLQASRTAVLDCVCTVQSSQLQICCQEIQGGGQEGPLIIWEERRPDDGNLSESEAGASLRELSEEDSQESEDGELDAEETAAKVRSSSGSSQTGKPTPSAGI